MFVPRITNMLRLTATIEQVVNRLNYTSKINNDTIKIMTTGLSQNNIDMLKDKKKISSTHTNLGNNVLTER
jgi:hypothetical protein